MTPNNNDYCCNSKQSGKSCGFFDYLLKKNNEIKEINLIIKDSMLIFCQALIDYIKEKINVFDNYNDFDNYIKIVKEKNINIDEIIADIFSDYTIKNLLQKSNITKTPQNFLEAQRCAQVIVLALFKCNNFECLKNSLKNLTGLSYRQVYRDVKQYIPFLIEFNSNINVNKWLPSPKPSHITYEDCVKVAEESDKNMKFAMSREEFNNAMKNRGDNVPSQVALKWICLNKGHEWWAPYNRISNGSGCPYCYGKILITNEDCVKVAKESDKNMKFAMSREEFNNAMKNRGDDIPSQVPLKWICLNKDHEWWAPYNTIQRGKGCPYCFGNIAITYEDCVEVAEESDKNIKFAMSREEFNNAMKNRGDNVPSQVALKWACLNKDHEWWTSFNIISQGSGCPYCSERKGVIGKLSHPILECLSIILFKLKDCSIRHETYVNSNSYEFIDLVIERDKNFIDNIENFQNIIDIPNFMTQILIDFTLSLNFNTIIEKCYKSYQNEKRFLIIVLYSKENKSLLQEVQNLIQNLKEINFRKHIRVINFNQYLEFLNLIIPINSQRVLSENEKNVLQNLNYVIDLISDAFNSDKKLDELIELSNYYKEQLFSYNFMR